MRQFSGCEPLVGEVVGLRTFRVDESGMLLPLFSQHAWYDGVNTAECRPPAGGNRLPHPVASPDCECGFYMYGSEQAAARNWQVRYVQAIVSCWGSVVAGTQGVRAQYARIDALWLAPNTPKWVRIRVGQRYPSARMYSTREAMLAEHPLSALPCYQPPRRMSLLPRIGIGLLVANLLALGLLPWKWIWDSPVRWLWLIILGYLVAVTVTSTARRDGTGKGATNLLVAVAVAWLVAPAAGVFGWVLRVPVLYAGLVLVWEGLKAMRPGYFPIEKPRREPLCYGART